LERKSRVSKTINKREIARQVLMFDRIKMIALQKTRYLFYLPWVFFFFFLLKPSPAVELDIVIPVIETDLGVLPLCIEGLKKNINHPVKNIYLVSPNSHAIKDFAAANGLVFIEETSFFDYAPENINYIITEGPYLGLNRSGWIYQQLIKLSGKAGTCRYYITIDADHILLQPHTFITKGGRFVFYMSTEYHMPYYKKIKQLLSFYPFTMFSYVSHKMVFDKEELKKLQQAIENKNGNKESWDKIILSKLDTDKVSCFSEFELYGNFVDASKKVLLPWKEKMIKVETGATYGELKKLYPKKLSVTIPYYMRNKKA